jgi:biotin carboxyl carrier protein
MTHTFQFNDQTYAVRLEPQPDGSYQATINDQTLIVRATRLNDESWLLESDGNRVVVHTAAKNNDRFVHIEGRLWTLSVPDARASRRKSSRSGGDLTAQMPGQVVETLVSDGESVVSGQTLVILEAMKMEIRIAAPADGVVKKVLVSQGDIVDRGQPLIEMEITP